RISCSNSVRLIATSLVNNETGQITCYKSGQFMCSLHGVRYVLTKWLEENKIRLLLLCSIFIPAFSFFTVRRLSRRGRRSFMDARTAGSIVWLRRST
ncbi:hypothetical protein MX652_13135, partial [Thauera aromatica]